MSELVEFHVSSVWAIKPSAVRQIITRLRSSGFDKSGFLFDQCRNWFQITCQAHDELDIKKQLKSCLAEIEDHVLELDETVVDDDGAIVKSMDDLWIGPYNEKAVRDLLEFTEFRLPESFDGLPHREVWDAMTYSLLPMRLSDLLTKEHFQGLQNLHNVILGHNQTLTEVYIGAESADEIARVRGKLNVLLKIKELKDSDPTHLLWTEAHKEKEGFDTTIDTRFLANIDAALIPATFLDLAASTDSATDYEMLAEAITLRLCRWDESRWCHTSLVGPKLKPRGRPPVKVGKRRYRVRHRQGARKNLYGTGIGTTSSKWISPEKSNATAEFGNSPYGGGEIEKWLDMLEESHAVATTSVNEEATTGSSAILDAMVKTSPAPDDSLIIFDEPATPVTAGALDGKHVASLPTETPNLLDFDDVFASPVVAPVNSGLRPMKVQSDNVPTLSIAKTREPLAPLIEVDEQVEESVRPGSSRASSRRNHSKETTKSGSHSSKTSKAVARPDVDRAQFPDWFIRELNQAVSDLVSTGPYLRGRVSLRANLGRILITGMDYTALAFNPTGSQSNGWKKETLLHLLNQGSRGAAGHGVTFTRMLTQDGDDIEHMLSITDISTAQQFWKSEPMERVIYSFFCVSKGQQFFMDLEADDEGTKFKYALRTKQDDKGLIWIHCTLRSWDVCVIMSHIDTAVQEANYGEFAKSFLDSFSVTLPQEHTPRIQIGVHKGFGVSVESMRIRTTFRFLSSDLKSYLDITEVEETVFKPCNPGSAAVDPQGGPASPDNWMFYAVVPKRLPTDVRNSEERGMPTFWYEASVRSVAAEREFAANETMDLGERAPWHFAKLAELGVTGSICKPALRMVQKMDTVGAQNDNHQAQRLVLPRENTVEVPGANYVTKRASRENSPATSSSAGSRGRIPLTSPAAFVQTSGPPGTVAARGYGYLTPPSTVTSPMPNAARAAVAGGPPQKPPAGAAATGNNQNIIKAVAPGQAAGGGGFAVHGPRAAPDNRQPGRRVPSSTGSDASRGPVASYKPPNQFW